MNFGGGVLIGLSLCHWLPETRESKNEDPWILFLNILSQKLPHSINLAAIESFEFNTELPVTEILMVAGLLLIFALEVLVHKLLT